MAARSVIRQGTKILKTLKSTSANSNFSFICELLALRRELGLHEEYEMSANFPSMSTAHVVAWREVPVNDFDRGLILIAKVWLYSQRPNKFEFSSKDSKN